MPRKGDYLTWLKPFSNSKIPRSTLWRWSKNSRFQQDEDASRSSSIESPVVQRSDDERSREVMYHVDDFDFNFTGFDDVQSITESDDLPQDNSTENDDEDVIDEADGFKFEPLYHSAPVTVNEFMLMFLSIIISFNLSYKAVEAILQLLKIILPYPKNVLKSKYFFQKYFNAAATDITQFFYCQTCSSLLNENFVCPICQAVFEKSKLESENRCFFFTNIASFISDIISTYHNDFRPAIGTRFQEIYDMFGSFKVLTLSICTDGVSIFNSTSSSAWPILAVVNEIPSHAQFSNIFLMGMFFGEHKPNFHLYFKPLTKIFNKLINEGICHNGKKYIAIPITFVADSVARCQLQNIKQFNGKYGCTWCKHTVTRIPKGNGFVNVYSFTDVQPILRTHEGLLNDASIASSNGEAYFGVKGLSPLHEMPFYNLVEGFTVDLMHCVDRGVMRSLLHLWFHASASRIDESTYIGRHMSSIDDLLSKFKVPHCISRTPRSLKLLSFWKAQEFHNFLIFYGPFVLKDILPLNAYEHFLLLSQTMFDVLSFTQNQTDLDRIDLNFNRFVYEFQQIYGLQNMSYNIHLLLHISKNLHCFGPERLYYMYKFESYNCLLNNLFNGNQSICKQIVQRFNLLWHLTPSRNGLNPTNENTIICEDFLVDRLSTRKRHGVFPGISQVVDLDSTMKEFLNRFMPCSETVEVLKTVWVNGVKLTCSQFCKTSRKCSCYVKDSIGNFIHLLLFLNFEQNYYLVGNQLSVESVNTRAKKVVHCEKNLYFRQISSNFYPVIVFEGNNEIILIPQPPCNPAI